MTDEQIPQPEPETEQPTPEGAGQAPEMRAEDAVRFAMSIFLDLAWVYLGIRANPATGETKTDIAQARLAIDAYGALVQLAENRFDPREVRDLKNMLATLQMNCAQRAVASG